jgi:O-antigen ligase
MLLFTVILILIEVGLAALSPRRFIVFSLWIQTIPYTWNWDAQLVFDTPVGPLNVVAMQLFGFVLACLVVLTPQITRALSQITYFKWHAAFLLFCVVSISYAPSAAYAMRMIAKLLGPFLFMWAILTVVDTDATLRDMERAILGSGVIILGLALYARAAGINSDPNITMTGISGLGPPSMGPPVFSAHMLPVVMLALASYMGKRRTATLILLIASIAGILAALQRTSAGALYLGVSTILFFGTRSLWRLLLPSVAMLGLPALIVLSDAFRKRMFFGDANADAILSDPAKALGSVNGSGRFALWDDMLRRFFDPHPIFGSGVGATQDYLYTKVGATVVHSEYVRLLCEVGVVGLSLFAIAAVVYAFQLQRLARERRRSGSIRVAALASLGGLVAYLTYFTTDNGIDYVSQFGIYVFGLMAIALKSGELDGLVKSEEEHGGAVGRPAFQNLMR